MTTSLSSFNDELVAFVLGELEDLGGDWLKFGLEGVLMTASGEIQSTGVTTDMTDGSAASAVATCDIIAAAFGHGPTDLPDEIAEVVNTYGVEIRETDGLPDLAAKVLAIVSDPKDPNFGGTKGIHASADEFQSVAREVSARVARVAEENPGTWEHTPLDAGTFTVNWNEAS